MNRQASELACPGPIRRSDGDRNLPQPVQSPRCAGSQPRGDTGQCGSTEKLVLAHNGNIYEPRLHRMPGLLRAGKPSPQKAMRSSPDPSVMSQDRSSIRRSRTAGASGSRHDEPPMVTREVEIIYQAAALVHPKQSLDRQAGGFDGPQGGEDFVKSMKAGGLGGHGGTPALLHVRERSGIMACRGAAEEGVINA